MANAGVIDWEARKRLEDAVDLALAQMDDFQKWTAYQKLFNLDFRIERARFEIERLTPRKEK